LTENRLQRQEAGAQAPISIVTGAASGIGRACAELLRSRGNRLVLVDRNQEGLQLLGFESDIAKGDLITLCANVCSEGDMKGVASAALEHFGRIDRLVAAAGILRTNAKLTSLTDTTLDEWSTVLSINLTGTFLSNRAVLPAMIRQRQGDIINISSTSGRQGRAFDGPYSASKFGIIGLSESLAAEASAYGVRVQTILPDAVETPLWDQNSPAAIKPPDLLTPERVADLIVYMLELPKDAYLLNPIIAPMRSKKRRRKKQSPEDK
jgi:3-oxoacyl-[acyl-carrier protein] reductase